MPLTKKDKKMKRNFTKRYGDKEGKSIYYATMNKRISEGRPIDSPESKRLAARRKHHKKPHRKHKRKM